jgi:hypothetical protein
VPGVTVYTNASTDRANMSACANAVTADMRTNSNAENMHTHAHIGICRTDAQQGHREN